MFRKALIVGAIFAMLAVVLGAFGAHGLKPSLSASEMNTYQTAVTYQFYHSFALLITGIVYQYLPFRFIKLASLFFAIGIVLFCGSLYALIALKLTGTIGLRGIGVITPIGGVFFILGWIMLLMGFFKKK